MRVECVWLKKKKRRRHKSEKQILPKNKSKNVVLCLNLPLVELWIATQNGLWLNQTNYTNKLNTAWE